MKGQFITQPYLLSLNPSSEMQVVWVQRTPADGIVEFGSSHALGRCVKAACYELTGLRVPASDAGYCVEKDDNPPIRLWQCVAKIAGLHPGELVYYRCQSGKASTKIYFFHTAPLPGEPFRFAQISDLQGFNPCDKSVYRIGCTRPDFLLYSGDAVFHSWRADQWFDLQEPWQDGDSRKRAFFPCMQQENGAMLMQYCPTFFCPGNHEWDDMRLGTDKNYAQVDSNWTWSIFMQIFRPLYPEMDPTLSGKRWYSADYGDLHITSLHIQRWAAWKANELPGWRLVDPIGPGSPQLRWLEVDLARAKTKFKWVIQHWHLLNKGTDTQSNLCQPVIDANGSVSYPDDWGSMLMDLFEKYGVNAVSYGHSHVYERYYAKGVHYIEAAYLGCCCREENAPLHPSGLVPVVEDNSRQSFLILERQRGGIYAT
ncbi:MAG: metallophosphoesterase family protein, partial [Gemmiger sp.]